MNLLKKILVSLAMVSALGAISTTAMAESDPGRIALKPDVAVDNVVSKIRVALAAITSGSESEKTSDLIKEAADSSKEINANDRVDRARAKANNLLKSARAHAKENAPQEAEQELREAIKAFEGLKSLF
ncbi:MAG: hypothetical protein ABL919_14285 [Methylococcales bacterium]|nr:hypothetical protein [Methylococcaceae bacterium]